MTEISLSDYVSRPKSMKKRPNTMYIGALIAGVIILSLGFLGGMQYQKHKSPSTTTIQTSSSQSSTQRYGGGPSGRFQGGARSFGTVSSVSSSSITVQSRNGSTNTYNITGSTTVDNNGQTASVSDIQTGDMVILTLDSSNMQNVSSITLNPSFGGFGGSSPTDSTSGSATGA